MYKKIEDVAPGLITTYSGREYDPFNFDPNVIDIVDVAHSLSLQCRWNGHCKKFLSIAEHCVYVSNLCVGYELEGLLHDASEAYLADIPTPIKSRWPGYRDAEKIIQDAIYLKYGCNPEAPIKWADTKSLYYEWDNYMMGADKYRSYIRPANAEKMFLNRFKILTNE